MTKLLRLLLALVGVIVIVMLAVDNREIVEITFWPLPFSLWLPLYALFLVGLFAGALLGGVALWLSSRSDRRESRALRRKMRAVEYRERLERERRDQEILEQARRKTQSLALAAPQP
jgi:lipopolysaccharide assembly protein A